MQNPAFSILVIVPLLAAWGIPGADAPRKQRRAKATVVKGTATEGERSWTIVADGVIRSASAGATSGGAVVPRAKQRGPVAVITGANQVCERRRAGEIECHDIGPVVLDSDAP